MKLINHLATLAVICLVLAGCSNRDTPEPESGWMGEWVNRENSEDIIIIERDIIWRFDLNKGEFNHKYNYKINGDSISLAYNGMYYLYTAEMIFKFNFDAEKKQIEIENIHTYFPMYEGDIFIKKDNH